MKKKFNFWTILIYVVLIGIIIFAISSVFSTDVKLHEISYTEMIAKFRNNEVYGYVTDINEYKVIIVDNEEEWELINKQNLTADDLKLIEANIDVAMLTSEQYYQFFNPHDAYTGSLFAEIQEDLKDRGVVSRVAKTESTEIEQTPWILEYLPMIIMVVLFVIFMIIMFRQQNGGTMKGFGRSKSVEPTNEKAVTFADVAGADEEKEELKEVVEFLKNPGKFAKLGAKIPHGVLLMGPPGTGKTLLAKAVAGEAGVPFYSMSGSDFVELYVGMGASRVRDLFEQARKTPAAIIFIDEIDAVGRQRGTGLGGGHDEREQTLNQLLVEMDGFGGHSGIIVIAATNRPDILDAALLRPGRFDRQITINYPDLAGREAILNVHAKGKPFEKTVDFHKIAQTTVGFTGADLANLLNEAALLAARRGKALIGMDEIEDSWVKVSVGTQKKNKMSEKEKYNTAIHEAGHAILAHLLPKLDPVRQISIIPSGRALGYTLVPPTEDKYSESKQEMLENITMTLGGRVAEQIIFGDYTGGASGDIQSVTATARKMVTVYGMSDELGPIRYGAQHNEVFLGRDFGSTPDYSEATAAKIDAEIKRIVSECYENAFKLLTEKKEKLKFVADFLIKHEVMDDAQFAYAMQDGVTMEQVEALVTEKQRRSQEENKAKEQETQPTQESERARLERELGLADDEPEEKEIEKAAENKTEEASENKGTQAANGENTEAKEEIADSAVENEAKENTEKANEEADEKSDK